MAHEIEQSVFGVIGSIVVACICIGIVCMAFMFAVQAPHSQTAYVAPCGSDSKVILYATNGPSTDLTGCTTFEHATKIANDYNNLIYPETKETK